MNEEEFFNEEDIAHICKIKIIGIGGGGNNAVNRMMEAGLQGVEFWVANTDMQVLRTAKTKNQIILGRSTTRGLGAGANPNVGKEAALESEQEIRDVIRGTDLVFLAAGMGGGTGTGAAPEFARIAREEGALTIGVVTRPFSFEGKARNANAIEGIERLKEYVDSLIIVSNDKLLMMNGSAFIKDAFKQADDVLRQSVQSITDLIALPSVINLDFADIRTVMANKGTAMIGFGIGKGAKKAHEAAMKAISSPLLESNFMGARNAIVNITCGETVTLDDTNEVAYIIKEAAGTDINIIIGYSFNEKLDDEMIVSVIATDFDERVVQQATLHNDSFNRKPQVEVQERLELDMEEDVEKEKEEEDSLIPSFLQNQYKDNY